MADVIQASSASIQWASHTAFILIESSFASNGRRKRKKKSCLFVYLLVFLYRSVYCLATEVMQSGFRVRQLVLRFAMRRCRVAKEKKKHEKNGKYIFSNSHYPPEYWIHNRCIFKFCFHTLSVCYDFDFSFIFFGSMNSTSMWLHKPKSRRNSG